MSSLAERVQRVRLLLETLNDPYPDPQGALQPDSGPDRGRYVPCETCKRTGWVKARHGHKLCLSCDGRGWRRRERSDIEWDGYLEMPVTEAAQLPREPSGRRPLEPTEGEPPFGWERKREAFDRSGSYEELRRALAWLRATQPRRWQLVRSALIDHEPRTLTDLDVMNVDLGVTMLALRMRTVRVPTWLMERSRAAERRETIEALAAQGLTAGEIARRLGMPKRVVRRRIGVVNSARAGDPARAS
jgi:hypothetical protein